VRLATLFLLLLSEGQLAAQGLEAQAKLPDGKQLSGELSLAATGRLLFRSEAKEVPLESIGLLKAVRGESVPLRSAIPVEFRLIDRQVLTGKVIGIDVAKLTLRTAWADAISIPRGALARMSHPARWQPIFVDSFETLDPHWDFSGKAQPREGDCTSGKFSLVLDAAGQSALFTPREKLAAGKLGLNIRGTGMVKTRRCWVELEFAGEKGPAVALRIGFGGPGDSFEVQSAGKAEYRGDVRRGAGWQRLSVEFSPEAVQLFVDDLALWSQAEGPGGRLRKCRLICEAAKGAGEGAFHFDEFALYAAAPKAPEGPPADPSQDAVSSREGDLLFGNLTRADPSGLALEGRFGSRNIPWTATSAIELRRLPVTAASTVGEHVRLTLRFDEGGRDLLEGAVKSLDRKAMVLSHAFLGDLTIPAARIDEIRPRFFGQEIVVDCQPHHLGKRKSARFLVPKPEGLNLIQRCKIAEPAEGATLVVEACHVVGSEDNQQIAESLKRGGMRTAVFINNKRVGSLNDLVDRASPEPKRLRLAIPNGLLTAGDNVMEFRQTIDPETGASADCEIRSIRLELTTDRKR